MEKCYKNNEKATSGLLFSSRVGSINSCDSGLWTEAGGKVKGHGEDTTSKLDREVQKWMSGNSTLSFQKDPEQSKMSTTSCGIPSHHEDSEGGRRVPAQAQKGPGQWAP